MTSLKVSAALMWFIAIPFGGMTGWAAVYLLREGRLPPLLGITAYGGPLFGRCSTNVFLTALAAFAAVSGAELFGGWLLWEGHRYGAVLALALLPAEAFFWASFALPIPPMVGVIRLLLLYAGWSSLR